MGEIASEGLILDNTRVNADITPLRSYIVYFCPGTQMVLVVLAYLKESNKQDN
jgi:hypothetical protein